MSTKIQDVVAKRIIVTLKAETGEKFYLTISEDGENILVNSELNAEGRGFNDNSIVLTPTELFNFLYNRRPVSGIKDFGDREIFQHQRELKKTINEPSQPKKSFKRS